MKHILSTYKSVILLFLLFAFATTYAQQKGKASYYADKFEGKKTASGQVYKHELKTAAHRTFPFGTKVKVTNVANGKNVVVTINDRGPFVKGRIIDLSKSAASQLDGVRAGIIEVEIVVLKEEKE
ncbi:septal ring lytic transglycosylase RlpA family protein [Plebeiibacterium marinum]|uniref:Probable endolytic peptidoglycan transglycosylase RlpA n=1 Tax=Plebeiibacterium marinum TaxID=2992111 RepID=A0AAE3SLJ9_9BACT|nr:septal ring lytic transglycosylase RlpA family protein [Plebeiobacterium marinum]MCW3807787.1 septal ring lytic transglycosylase RlpA family protein [Plebeiobacterium marinum]